MAKPSEASQRMDPSLQRASELQSCVNTPKAPTATTTKPAQLKRNKQEGEKNTKGGRRRKGETQVPQNGDQAKAQC